MIGSVRATLAGVPALVYGTDRPGSALEHGTVLFYHGFGGSKASSEPYLTALAGQGFLAVGLDAVGHGARRFPGFDIMFSARRWHDHFEETESDFLRVIDQTAAEVPAVIDALTACGWAREDALGIAGRSLGGSVAYAAVLADSRVRAMASVVGSPQWTLPRPQSPHNHPHRFFPAAVLSIAAELDEHSPPAQIRDFHSGLRHWYTRDSSRNEFVEYPGTGHSLTPGLNADSRARLVSWFRRWLPDQQAGA